MSLFVDTSAIYALLVRSEREHDVRDRRVPAALTLDRHFAEAGYEVVPTIT